MTQVTPGLPVVFSTAGLPEARRTELWENHNAEALIGLHCRTLSTALLEATEINLQLERVHLARVRGNPHVVERDQALISRRPANSVALFFSLAGQAFFYDEDGVRTVRPGQLLICDADRPFLRGFSQGLEELVLKVPRDLFAQATGIEQVTRPVLLDFAAGANSFAQALARAVGSATRAENPRPVAERTLLGLIGALAGGDQPPAAHRTAAETYIDRHLDDPALTAPRIAAAVGISARHLSRIFAQAGTSVPQYVLRRRLERACARLQSPGTPDLTVAEIARQCGFASAAHFSGAFRSHFGERAVDVRRRALTGTVSRPGPLA